MKRVGDESNGVEGGGSCKDRGRWEQWGEREPGAEGREGGGSSGERGRREQWERGRRDQWG